MRTWGQSGAGAVIRRAQEASSYARRTGCPVDEATEIIDQAVTRRRFLTGVGAAAAAVLPTALASPASAATRRERQARRADAGGVRNGKAKPNVVIVGSGIAGLGRAYMLWRQHGIQADIYEYNTVPGGRIRTLRNYFSDGQLVEEHAEFINPEHKKTLALAKSFGLTLDNSDKYPDHINTNQETMRFGGRAWPQAQLTKDWHDWGWQLFHDAAFTTAPWPVLYNDYTPGGQQFDQMSVTEWINAYIPGGVASDFGALCVSAVLDEFGGPADENSALNLVYLLGQDDSNPNGFQPHRTPALGGANEKWHIHGGTDLLISGLIDRLPTGTVNLGQKLVALKTGSSGGYVCTFESGASTQDVVADHVVLALPFTTLRLVDLSGVADTIAPLHMQAINEEPLGSNAKFFAQFSSRIWNAQHATGNAYCGGVVQGAWDPTVYQPGQAGILAALPGGDIGIDWGKRFGLTNYYGQPPAAMVEAYLNQYEELFPGIKSLYNGESYYVWSTGDPHILGAYSYLKVGQYTGFNGIQGQQEENLHFAGEQTSINFQGYVEGGLRSGYKCALEVMAKA